MDYARWYERISSPFRGAGAARTLNVLDKALVYLIAAVYLALAAWLFATGNPSLARFVAVPAATFAAVTALRAALDAPRPYDLHDIDPVIARDAHGKSMPSRHVASAVAIACALWYLDPAWGIPAFAACAVVAFTRIVGGVHFPRDVAAAVALALVIGIVGFAIVP